MKQFLDKFFLLIIFLGICSPWLYSQESNYRIDKVEIEGLKRTKESVIKNNFFIKKDDVFSQEMLDVELKKGQEKLESLGLFADVDITQDTVTSSPEDIANGVQAIIIKIVVVEQWSLLPFFSYGYDSEKGHSFPFALADTNALGYNKKIIVAGLINQYDTSIIASYIDPSINWSLWSTILAFAYGRTTNFGYDVNDDINFQSVTTAYFGTAELRRYYSKEQAGYTSLYSEIAQQNEAVAININNVPLANDNDSWFVGVKQGLGRLSFFKGLRYGQEVKALAGVTPYYSLYPDFRFNVTANSSHIDAAKTRTLGVKTHVEARGNSLYYPAINGLKEDELQGNWGMTLSLKYNQMLNRKDSDIILVYWQNSVEGAVASDWKDDKPLEHNSFRYTFTSGVSLYLFKIPLPIGFGVSYNLYRQLYTSQTPWQFNVGFAS